MQVVARVRGLPPDYHQLLDLSSHNLGRVRRQLLKLKREGRLHGGAAPSSSSSSSSSVVGGGEGIKGAVYSSSSSSSSSAAAAAASASASASPSPPSSSSSAWSYGDGNVVRILLYGDTGAGKSALAAWIARESSAFFDTVEVISPADGVGGGYGPDASAHGRPPLERFRHALEDARKERYSLILLDDLDGMTEYIEGVQGGGGGRNRYASQGLVASLRQVRQSLVLLSFVPSFFFLIFPFFLFSLFIATRASLTCV
jgi:hypothetical protein